MDIFDGQGALIMSDIPATALVIGAGSIGKRHQRVLTGLGMTVGMVSRHGGPGTWTDLDAAVPALAPGYVVVATETADHGRVLDRLAALDYRGRVLVEKPLFAAPRPLPDHRFATLAVGYNLRFHPILRHLVLAQTITLILIMVLPVPHIIIQIIALMIIMSLAPMRPRRHLCRQQHLA